MKYSTNKREIEITLTLTEREARILAGLVQNPLCKLEDEPLDVGIVRRDIFDAINRVLDE